MIFKLIPLLALLFCYAATAGFQQVNGGAVYQKSIITSAASTTTLVATSNQAMIVEGSTTHTIKLPSAILLPIDWSYEVANNSTGAVSVVDNSSGALATVGPSQVGYFHLRARSTAAGTWKRYVNAGLNSVGTIVANAQTATALAANPTDCAVLGTFASGIDVYGNLTCSTPLGSGDVTGPGSSTDNAIVRFDGITGKLLQGSGATIDDSGNITANGFVGPVTGNADTATALAANPADCGANEFSSGIAANGDLTCSSIPNAATTASSSAGNSTIVARDGSGNFAAGTITASLTGLASLNEVPLTFGDGLTRTTNDIDCDIASGSVFGCLASADWTTFNGKQAGDADLTALAALSGTNTIYYRSGASTWSAVTVGTGLSFSGGTLSASSSGATVSTATTPITNPENLLSTGPGASPTNVAIQYWRLGDRMYVSGTLTTAGTLYGPPAFMAVPEGLSIDATKLGLSNTVGNPGKMVGLGMMGTANVNAPLVTAAGTNGSTIYFGNSLNSAAHLTPTGFSSVFSTSALLSFDYNIPIKEWSNTEASSGTIQGDCLGGSSSSSGDYDICTYDTAGSYTFTFSSESGDALYTVEAIGGGGSGGAGSSGGGGGAGGFCRGVNLSAANGALSLSVGAGGVGANGAVGNDGADSTFDGATAKGGGKGGYADGTANANGSDGGSGGGGGDDSSANTAGASTQVIASGNLTCYGSPGGTNYGASPFNAGGGGSPTMPGESVGPDGGGAGGQGKKSIITGAVYAGGGGGGAGSSGGAHGRGGTGGGGNAGSPTRGCEGADGSAYGAGGGGVGRSCSGTTIAGDGYKGAVIIKWKAR